MVGKKMKFLSVGIIIMILMMGIVGCQKEEISKTKIGIIQIVEHPALDDAREGFKAKFEDESVVFFEENAQGDIANAQMIVEKFKEEKVDLIYAIATPVAQAAYNSTKEIPIIISAVTDPLDAGLIKSWEEPSTNVSGTSDIAPIQKQIELISKMGIKGKKIGFIYNSSESNSEVQLRILIEEAGKLGYEVETKSITTLSELEQTLQILLENVDMLYTPTDNLIASGMSLIVNKSNKKKIPIIGGEQAHVEAGALYTCGVDYKNLGGLSGEMAKKVLAGEDISEMKIEKSRNPKLVINLKTLELLDLIVDDEIKSSAELIGGN